MPRTGNYKRLDVTNFRSGRLVAKYSTEARIGTSVLWFCECDCGGTTLVTASRIKNHVIQSCGCLWVESITRHGRAYTTSYRSWRSMIDRCTNSKHKSFKDYGQRGIGVCTRWLELENFVQDMGEPPPGHSLERINNEKGYSPDNCRWATTKEQARNRRNSRLIEWRGEIKTLIEWADVLGVRYGLLQDRLDKQGWSIEDAFTKPARRINVNFSKTSKTRN